MDAFDAVTFVSYTLDAVIMSAISSTTLTFGLATSDSLESLFVCLITIKERAMRELNNNTLISLFNIIYHSYASQC